MPTVTIRIPQVLRHHTDGARSVEVEAVAVHEALEALFAVYPTLRESLTPPSGNVLEATNLFLNERDVATLDGLDSPAGRRRHPDHPAGHVRGRTVDPQVLTPSPTRVGNERDRPRGGPAQGASSYRFRC